MIIFEEALDPSETKDFSFDWSPQLGDGETVTGHFVTFVDAAGTTNPSNSLASPVSRVWLSGGTHGGRAIFTILATTSGGRSLEAAFGVNIVDVLVGPTAETSAEELTRMIREAKGQRHAAALGSAVIDVWRDGRRVRRQVASLEELNNYIRILESDLTQAQIDEGITPTRRRHAMTVAYRN